MALIGFLIALFLFFRVKEHLDHSRPRAGEDDEPRTGSRSPSWHEAWSREWAEKFHHHAEDYQHHWEHEAKRWTRRAVREARRWQRRAEKRAKRGGATPFDHLAATFARSAAAAADATQSAVRPPDDVLRRARRRAAAETAFHVHFLSYLGVIALLAFINFLTTRYPWFIWPALGWGIGVFAHYTAVFGTRQLRERYFDPAVEREVRREKAVMQTEKQASIDELSSTLAHELRNPIAAAKSLVQQMGEDPTSLENPEYAKVAVEELDRVERSISHLLKYAREEDYEFAPVPIATVVDAALTELRSKLDAAKVAVARNYIGGPTIVGDKEKLRQVFANIVDNAIDALGAVAEDRRIEVFVQNGAGEATVRIRDNGRGIPKDKIDKIFNPFFTTKEKGTGLGMAICKKLVEAHAGTIDVISETGRGTEFIVSLPLPR
jgi:signal transduction histidine kinase